VLYQSRVDELNIVGKGRGMRGGLPANDEDDEDIEERGTDR